MNWPFSVEDRVQARLCSRSVGVLCEQTSRKRLLVRFNCPEFTSLCPITGQPDFAEIRISYLPDVKWWRARAWSCICLVSVIMAIFMKIAWISSWKIWLSWWILNILRWRAFLLRAVVFPFIRIVITAVRVLSMRNWRSIGCVITIYSCISWNE